MKRSGIGFVVSSTIFLVIVTFIQPTLADDTNATRETLRGISGFPIVVEDLPQASRNLVSEAQLTKDIEEKLKTAGIKVLSKEEGLKQPGSPYLYVNSDLYQLSDGFIVKIVLEVRQQVNLARNPNSKAFGSTWSIGVFGGVREIQDMREALKGEVETFIKAYFSVNPK